MRNSGIHVTLESFSFASHKVLSDISLTVQPGETLSVLGPSGCGKSTLIGIIAGLLPRRASDGLEGDVRLFGESPKEYRASGRLSVMFQDPTLLPHLTVEQNLRLPLDIIRMADSDKRVANFLRLMGLERFRAYLPRDLSGGMRTRVALARSLVFEPELLLMDEPFVGLDLGWKESLYNNLSELRRRNGITTLMVTHDLEEAVYNSDKVIVMSARGTSIEEILIPGTFPRSFGFGDTIANFTEILSHLSGLLTGHVMRSGDQ